jgi:cobalt-zinc-cadmium efflux system membrane fusion protein
MKTLHYLVLVAVLLTSLLTACGGGDTPKQGNQPAKVEPAKAPLVEKVQVADWCKEHGVPESVCTRCNESLVAGFKAKGDWCKEHDLPESQCIACHPELEAKLKALAPKEGG